MDCGRAGDGASSGASEAAAADPRHHRLRTSHPSLSRPGLRHVGCARAVRGRLHGQDVVVWRRRGRGQQPAISIVSTSSRRGWKGGRYSGMLMMTHPTPVRPIEGLLLRTDATGVLHIQPMQYAFPKPKRREMPWLGSPTPPRVPLSLSFPSACPATSPIRPVVPVFTHVRASSR